MPGAGGGDTFAAGQGGCGRAIFQHSFEHCFRTARHGEPFGKDHDRSGGGVYVDCAGVGITDPEWLAFSVAVSTRKRTGGNTHTVSGAAVFTGRAGSITRCEQVAVFENGTAIIAEPSKLTSCRSGGTGRRARLRGV